MKTPKCIFLTLLLLTVTVAKGAVIINEINYNPPGSEDSTEFVELFNTASEDVNLENWEFSSGFSFVFPSGAVIPGRGYAVVARRPELFKVQYPACENVYGPFLSGKLSNSGEAVELRTASGAVSSRVFYLTGGDWPESPDGDGPTLELRNANMNLSDGRSWGASTKYAGTPGAENSIHIGDNDLLLETMREPISPLAGQSVTIGVRALFGQINNVEIKSGGATIPTTIKDGWYTGTLTAGAPDSVTKYTFTCYGDGEPKSADSSFKALANHIPQGSVIINEIMHDSGLAAYKDDYQYVELYNRSDKPVDLKNCLVNGIEINNKSQIIQPGKYLVLPSKRKTILEVYGNDIDVANCKLKLFAKSGNVRLTDCNGGLIHEAAYGNTAPWPSLACGAGYSLELLTPDSEAKNYESWGVSKLYGSPGKPNTAGGETALLQVNVFAPDTPLSNTPLPFAFLIAGDNIQDVKLQYGLASTDLKILELNFDASDGLYKGTIPALGQEGILRYRLVITKDGQKYNWPQQSTSAPEPQIASATSRMSYQSHYITVTPTEVWQKATITDNASDSQKMYIYMDARGEMLVDKFEMRDANNNYIVNSDFVNNIYNWTLYGNHSGTFWDNTDGYEGLGCMHIVATSAGGGYSSGGYLIPAFTANLATGNQYTLSFYYKLPPLSVSPLDIFEYLEIGRQSDTIAITEINYHETHAAFGNCEYLELQNYGDKPVDVSGWTLTSEENGTANLPCVVIPPGGFIYLCADTNAFLASFSQKYFAYNLDLEFDHSSDALTLKNLHGQVVDSVAYNQEAPWPVDADGGGATLERRDPKNNGTDPLSWSPAYNGSVGYGFGDFYIKDAFHNPAVPTSSSSVYFYCYPENFVGTPNGTLYYRVNNGDWQTKFLSYSSSEKRLSTSVSGFNNNSQISFYFVVNSGAESRTFPVWGASRPCMLEIDNTTDYQIPVYRIMMTQENYQKLSNKRLWNNDKTDGTVIIGTNIYYNSAIHYKGNYSRQYRIAHNIHFNYGKRYHGHRKVAYTYNWEDGSPYLAVAYAQRIYRLSNTPIYDSEPLLARRMGSLLGLMHSVEGYDEPFLEKLGYDGNCYKATAADDQQAMFSFANYKKKTYKNCYEFHGGTQPTREYKDLARGLESLYIFNEKDFNLYVTNYFDIQAAAREWAMTKFLNNSDGWTQWGQNYILFGDAINNRVQLWPQDIGSCIVWGNLPFMPIVGGIQRFVRHPAVFKAMYQNMTQLMRTIPRSKQLAVFDDLRDQCRTDALRRDSNYDTQASNLRNTISSWATAVNSSVGSPTYITNLPFAFRSLPPRSAMVGEPYYYRPFAFDPQDRKVLYSCSGNDNLSIDADGLISGVFPEKGSYSYTVRASAGGKIISQSVTVFVEEPALRLHIPMDEGEGNTVSDLENKMTGNLVGTIVWDDEGRYGKCLSFGGSDDIIEMGSNPDINITGNFTCEMWLYFTQRNRNYWGRLFKKYEELGFRMNGDSGTHHGGLIAWGPFDNGYSCATGFTGDGDTMIMCRYNPDDNYRIMEPKQWHHLAVTHERDKNEAYVYVDGKRVSGLVWSSNLLGTSPLFLGGYLNGKLDEFKIYSFAKRAFNMGINIEAVQTIPDCQYIQFHTFDRGANEEFNLKYYAVRLMPGDKWYILPSEKIKAGEDYVLYAEDIAEDFELAPSGSISLYPYEPDTIWPEYYLTNDYTKILDYVAWGDASALPDENEPAVKAGLWKAGTIVLPTERSFRLKERGQNNRGAASWENSYSLEPPKITEYTLTNYFNQIEGAWTRPTGVYTYRLQYADNTYFENAKTIVLAEPQVKLPLSNGTWYWRVQAIYSEGGSVYPAPITTYLEPEPASLALLLLLGFALLRKKR